jgi:hypothetical protein
VGSQDVSTCLKLLYPRIWNLFFSYVFMRNSYNRLTQTSLPWWDWPLVLTTYFFNLCIKLRLWNFTFKFCVIGFDLNRRKHLSSTAFYSKLAPTFYNHLGQCHRSYHRSAT